VAPAGKAEARSEIRHARAAGDTCKKNFNAKPTNSAKSTNSNIQQSNQHVASHDTH
jgi:hypothetical protein